jgi:Protein of unknown function (DUF3618)
MTGSEPRTTEQIRKEIVEERAQLDEKLAALGAEAKRSGRIAGSALAALGSAALVIKLLARRRAR